MPQMPSKPLIRILWFVLAPIRVVRLLPSAEVEA